MLFLDITVTKVAGENEHGNGVTRESQENFDCKQHRETCERVCLSIYLFILIYVQSHSLTPIH